MFFILWTDFVLNIEQRSIYLAKTLNIYWNIHLGTLSRSLVSFQMTNCGPPSPKIVKKFFRNIRKFKRISWLLFKILRDCVVAIKKSKYFTTKPYKTHLSSNPNITVFIPRFTSCCQFSNSTKWVLCAPKEEDIHADERCAKLVMGAPIKLCGHEARYVYIRVILQ